MLIGVRARAKATHLATGREGGLESRVNLYLDLSLCLLLGRAGARQDALRLGKGSAQCLGAELVQLVRLDGVDCELVVGVHRGEATGY